MDPFQIKRLQEEHHKGLQACKEKITKWEKFKVDYEALKERLSTLPDSLSYDVTVPFGNSAFTKGKIVHTNEITVLLGDNWFVEVSAKQAVGIASRRIAHCIKTLDDLNKEKQQFENWLQYIDEFSGKEELVEIIEDYDDEREKSWKEQHAKNVQSYRQQLARERKYSEDTNGTSETDEDYLDKLSKLELKEGIDSDRSTIDCSDDGSHSEEHPSKPSLKLNINGDNFRKNSESETGDDLENSSPGNNKHVRWQDLSKHNIRKITFKHSKPKKQQNTTNAKHKMYESSEDENHPLIQSPSDIYKKFGNFFQSSPPKSILKVKSPPPSINTCRPIFPTKDMVFKETSPETDEIFNSPFTGEIRERTSPIQIVESKSSRPISHFKNSRKNRKR